MPRVPVPPARPPLLPALAVGALALGLAAQFALPVHTSLPEVGLSRARALARRIAVIVPVTPSLMLTERTLFAPSRRFDPGAGTDTGATTASGTPVTDPFEGVMLTGIARDRAFAVAVIHQSTGTTMSLRPGGRIGQWRLINVGAGSASFASAGVVRTLRVGETAKVQPLAAQQAPEVTQP